MSLLPSSCLLVLRSPVRLHPVPGSVVAPDVDPACRARPAPCVLLPVLRAPLSVMRTAAVVSSRLQIILCRAVSHAAPASFVVLSLLLCLCYVLHLLVPSSLDSSIPAHRNWQIETADCICVGIASLLSCSYFVKVLDDTTVL